MAREIVILRLFMMVTTVVAVMNGNFEEKKHAPPPCQVKLNETDELQDWNMVGAVSLFAFPGGGHAALLDMGAEINQLLEVNQCRIYTLSFSAAITCVGYVVINVTMGDETRHLRIGNHYDVEGLQDYAVAFRAPESAVAISFVNPNNSVLNCQLLVDNVVNKELEDARTEEGNLLVNGHFLVGPSVDPKLGVFSLDLRMGMSLPCQDGDVSPLPGWEIHFANVLFVDSGFIHDTQFALAFVNGNIGKVLQRTRTTHGGKYMLSFSVSRGTSGCTSPLSLIGKADNLSTEVLLEPDMCRHSGFCACKIHAQFMFKGL